MIAAFCIAGQAFGLPAVLSKATLLVPLALPLPLVVFAFRKLNVGELSHWPAIWSTCGIATLGIAAFAGGAMRDDPREKDRAYQLEKEMRWYRTITSLGDVDALLRFMSPETFPEIRALAIADLAKRPNLVAEFAEVFANGGVSDGAGAARYLKEMPAAPGSLIEPYTKFADRALKLIAESLTESEFSTYAGHAEAVAMGAEALRTHTVDRQIAEMNAAIARFKERPR
jgi:hypothetical protein